MGDKEGEVVGGGRRLRRSFVEGLGVVRDFEVFYLRVEEVGVFIFRFLFVISLRLFLVVFSIFVLFRWGLIVSLR